MDVLSHLVLTIDFDEGKVGILRSARGASGKAVPIIWHERTYMREGPFIAARLDGDLPCEFLVDTGACHSILGTLDTGPFDFLVQDGAIKRMSVSYSTHSLGRTIQTPLGRLTTMEVAGYKHEGAVFGRLAFFNSLGLEFLSRYVITLDFPNNFLYLRPGKRFGRSHSYIANGIYLRRQEGNVVVGKLKQGSHGHLSGVQPGDVVVSVNGEGIAGWSLCRIERELCTTGRHTFVVHRGDEEVQLRLVLPASDADPRAESSAE
jgi:hypothetical protein